MCTYNFSLSDAAIDRIRPAFKDETAMQAWLQKQLENAVMNFDLTKDGDYIEAMQEKEAFLYTSRVNASKMFAKYL